MAKIRKKTTKKSKNENSALETKMWIIGVGASAGGLEAITEFVAHMPKDLNAAVIVAQHLAPHSKNFNGGAAQPALFDQSESGHD